MTPAAGDARHAGAVAAAIDIGSNSVLLIIVSAHGVRHAYLRAALARAGVPADFGELWP